MSDTKLYRYTIFYMLDEKNVGDVFRPSALHINILPWFALETDEKTFVRWFYDHFDNISAFEATVGQAAMFGPKHDVPVHIIEPHDKFLALHQLALSWFGALGARWAERDPYVGEDYKPHVAERHGVFLKTGQKIMIDAVTLVRGKRRDDHIREVVAKSNLKAG